jgi:hypothetical protein
MKKVDDAIDSLEIAVSLLEDAVVAKERHKYSKQQKAAAAAAIEDTLFSDNELSGVKQRLDDAIERLETALEGTDGPR